MTCRIVVFFGLFLLGLLSQGLAGEQDKAGQLPPPQLGEYRQVRGPCSFEFPRDYGAHPGYRTEWWYYTGHLEATSGRAFGFQLTFFRIQISPPGAETHWPEKPSAWRTQQVFLAHAALSDLRAQRFHYDEQVSRGAVGLAGAGQNGGVTTVFLGSWSAVVNAEKHVLRADTAPFRLDLTCRPLKSPVAHGDRGYSRKGSGREKASCYYSFTRLGVTGRLVLSGKPFAVEGTAWMDHEYGTAPLEEELKGWDWFSLQLSDGTELMVYLLRLESGGAHPASGGTYVSLSGGTQHLSKADVQVEIVNRWKSRRTGASYPSRWHVRVVPFDLDLILSADLPDQELITEKSTRVIYWEGHISAKGRKRGKPLTGTGYVELTGYAVDFDFLK